MNTTAPSRRTRSRLLPAGAAMLTTTALALTGCMSFVTPEAAEPAGVGFDDIQTATIQIEAVGTFVSPEMGGYEAAGRGSGFLISEDGLAVTNNHVVVGAGTLKVWRGGDTSETLNAKVLGSSECLDLAVIQLQDDDYPHFTWREGEITTATDVYAAGFPLGDPEFTMTRGIVSKADTAVDTPWASLDHVIEHDARIRGGNSGGPLIDAEGRLVGVNYAGNDQYDQNLAIHRDEVQKVIEQLSEGESVLSLGINGTALMTEEGEGLGIWVNSVASGSAADTAGVAPGDLLTKMEGVSVGVDGTMADYCDVLRTHGHDATLSVELYRPAEGVYYTGQFNGEPVEAVSVATQAGASSGGGGTGGSGGSGAVSAEEYVSIVDDTGSVTVDVPAAWGDLDTSVYTDPRGGQWARIDASTDVAAFASGWSVPGVSVVAAPAATATIQPEEWLGMTADYLEQSGCTQGAIDEYTDDLHSGVFQYWTGCGESAADYLMLAAYSNDGQYVIVLAVTALTESDLYAIDHALGSFAAAF
ncbi:S1C family serine protease [Microbacterium kunmingense]|uniref:S1C family serine protease n=2 Tax=Microbacterium kunmingense TaxID=2915939 RepID=UPI002005E4A8|nr:trypsin-like peptidase domain-containing protein [Microbacterium kunmingense]